MKQLLSITGKELKAYFGSPMAAIFIGAFLLSALFSFFWVEIFFARNIADIRPLFRWMPLLMIFLVAALTMRQWSEEQKMGTLEVLLTLPVRLSQLVLGKFLAVLTLVAIALTLTIGLPVTVAILGDIDWGPVFGGYLGALLMAASYIAIGLYVSSRTDNQIIALILTVLLCGILYLLGSNGLTSFMGNETGEIFRAVGTGSRFVSIERGVIDVRDLVYYLSLAGFFLFLNVVSLERKSWSEGKKTAGRRRNAVLATWLVGANLLALNVWLDSVHAMRVDLTEQREYSISRTTRDLLANLEEPLVMRGYFSEKTHPLLAPLVPRIKDMMEEYRIASGGKVEVSFVDPREDEEAEMEANQQYGIKPVPFQIAGRYEAAVVNSYFNILIKYGDQHETLGFNDLIEIQQRKGAELEVGLRNLEYDLTRTIKKVVYGFQGLAGIFDNMKEKARLIMVVTPGTLPDYLREVAENIQAAADELVEESEGKLGFEVIDPDTDAAYDRSRIKEVYGIEPLAVSLFDDETFYFHLFLVSGSDIERIYLTGDMARADIRQEIEASLKRTSSGFLKTVGVWLPPAAVEPGAMYQPQMNQDRYQIFKQLIRENYNLEEVKLVEGNVSGEVDVLLLVAPQNLTDLQKLAVDQYLMRGGSVIALAGNYLLDLTPTSRTLAVKKVENGLGDLLAHYGVTVGESLVMDKQNEPFPIPVTRNLGGFSVQEIQQIDYPFFVDVRSDGMDLESPVVSQLPAVTMNWVSPVTVDEQKNADRKVNTLLYSSPESWLHFGTDIQPDFGQYPQYGFAPGDSMQRHKLAVTIQGQFSSFYKDKPDPRRRHSSKDDQDITQEDPAAGEDARPEESLPPRAPIIRNSPESARLVIVGSSEFINDTVLGISQSMGQERFLNSLEFLQNLVDWTVADENLLAIRSRGTHARLLPPLDKNEQAFWEWVNYGFALLALVAISVIGAIRVRREEPMKLA